MAAKVGGMNGSCGGRVMGLRLRLRERGREREAKEMHRAEKEKYSHRPQRSS